MADQEHAKRRQLARQQRKHGAVPHQDAISADRQMAGYQLLEEAQRDAD